MGQEDPISPGQVPGARRSLGTWVRQGLAALAVLALVVVVRVVAESEDIWHAELAYADYDCSSGLVCTMRPGLDQVAYAASMRRYHVRTNATGFRGVDFPTGPKEAGVTRVAIFGSSPIFGLGVDDHETMPVRLAEALERLAPGRRFEVLNFGLPENYLASQLLSYRLFARALEPDVVVFVQPDLVHVVDMNERLLQLERSWFLRLLLRSRWSRPLVNRYQYLSMSLANRQAQEDGPRMIRERFAPVVEDLQKRGMKVVFFSFQGTQALDPADLPEGLVARSLDAGLTPEAYRASPWMLEGDGHPNPAGQAHFAGILAPAVLEAAGP